MKNLSVKVVLVVAEQVFTWKSESRKNFREIIILFKYTSLIPETLVQTPELNEAYKIFLSFYALGAGGGATGGQCNQEKLKIVKTPSL